MNRGKPNEQAERAPPSATTRANVSPDVTGAGRRSLSDVRLLRLLIESARDYAIFAMDRERRVNYWNSGAERLFGFTDREILGESADVIFTPEDRANGVPEGETATALREGRASDERWHLRRDGTRFFASGVLSPLHGGDSSQIGFVKIARDLTERKLAEDKLRAAHEMLESRVRERTAELNAAIQALREEAHQRAEAEESRQALLHRLAAAQEQERLRLSRELHDEVGQHIAALMLGLNSLEPHLRSTPGQPVLGQLQSLTETLSREVHALAVQLRPAALDDLGLVRAITSYAKTWSERSHIGVELHTGNLDERRLPPEVEVTLYRIVQEALTNVVKHAKASRVSILLNRQEGAVTAIVEDDGRGFDPDDPKSVPGGRLGLLGMRERAAQLNGSVTIESVVGQGTTVLVRIPVS